MQRQIAVQQLLRNARQLLNHTPAAAICDRKPCEPSTSYSTEAATSRQNTRRRQQLTQQEQPRGSENGQQGSAMAAEAASQQQQGSSDAPAVSNRGDRNRNFGKGRDKLHDQANNLQRMLQRGDLQKPATGGRSSDLALANAPKQVFELIGDPRSGVADDVSYNPFGGLTVEMVHHQPTNEVYWYKYEYSGNSQKEAHRDARLSEYSKNLMYILRAKDPRRWTVEALAKKFRIRRQRVMAILALKEMEAHRMERGAMLGGPLSAYALPVNLADVAVDGANGEPLDFNTDAARSLVQQSARGAAEAEPAANVLSGADGESAVRAANLPLHRSLPRTAVMAQAVQLQLLQALKPYGYDISALRAEVSAGFDAAAEQLAKQLPHLAAPPAAVEGAEDAAAAEEGAAAPAQGPVLQQLHEQKARALALLDALEPLLAGGLLDAERLHTQKVKALSAALQAAQQQPAAAAAEGAAAGGSSSAEVAAVLEGLSEGEVLRAALALPLPLRAALLEKHQPVRLAFNAAGVDLTAFVTKPDYAPAAAAAASIAAGPLGLPLDVFGFKYVSPQQYASLHTKLSQLEQGQVALRTAATAAAGGSSSSQGGEEAPLAATSAADLQQLQRLAGTYRSALQMVSGGAGLLESGREEFHNKDTRQRVLNAMHEVHPSLPEGVAHVEAIMQLTQAGDVAAADAVRALLAKERAARDAEMNPELGAVAEAAAKAAPAAPDAAAAPLDPHAQLAATEAAGRATSGSLLGRGSGAEGSSWDVVAAHLDAVVNKRIYHRGSGERQVARMPTYPAFDGYSLAQFDKLKEGELSAVNRAVAAKAEEQLVGAFAPDLLFNLGLRGEELADGSKPAPPTNLEAQLHTEHTKSGIVLYDIAADGATITTPLGVLLPDGSKRALNEQEKVFQERRTAREPIAYLMRRIKRKPELM